MTDEIRAPILWRRPKTKVYDYNQEFGCAYYKPMIDYVDSKERQGIFFERPVERIHLPDAAELVMQKHEYGSDLQTGTGNLDRFLIQAYSQQTKEGNTATVHTQNLMLRGSKQNTVLGPKLTATMLRDHYVKELHVIKARGGPGSL
jgi:hypothetical protein